MGQGFLNFNEYLPHLRGYADGDYCFYLLKRMIGLNTHGLSVEYLQGSLTAKTGIPIAIFYTYLGFFIIDVGPVWTFLFWGLIPPFIASLINKRNNEMTMSSLFVLFIYASMILNGTCLYYYSGEHGLRLIPVMFWYLLMRTKKI